MRAAEDAEVIGALAAPIGDDDVLAVDDAIVGAISDEREIGSEDVDEEDAERSGRLVFAIEKEEATP